MRRVPDWLSISNIKRAFCELSACLCSFFVQHPPSEGVRCVFPFRRFIFIFPFVWPWGGRGLQYGVAWWVLFAGDIFNSDECSAVWMFLVYSDVCFNGKFTYVVIRYFQVNNTMAVYFRFKSCPIYIIYITRSNIY